MKTAHAIIIAGAIIAGAILIKDDFPTKPAHALDNREVISFPDATGGAWIVDSEYFSLRYCDRDKCLPWLKNLADQ